MIQRGIYFCGVWEPAITSFVRQTLQAGDVFVDIGANIGYYSCLAAKLTGSTGRVHAIEASPTICTILEENLRINQAIHIFFPSSFSLEYANRNCSIRKRIFLTPKAIS